MGEDGSIDEARNNQIKCLASLGGRLILTFYCLLSHIFLIKCCISFACFTSFFLNYFRDSFFTGKNISPSNGLWYLQATVVSDNCSQPHRIESMALRTGASTRTTSGVISGTVTKQSSVAAADGPAAATLLVAAALSCLYASRFKYQTPFDTPWSQRPEWNSYPLPSFLQPSISVTPQQGLRSGLREPQYQSVCTGRGR